MMVTLLAEANGFQQVRNQRQLVNCVGLDVEKQELGTSVHKPARLSKKGNRHLQKALCVPAYPPIRCEATSRSHFTLSISKYGVKIIAVMAIIRKTLVLVYSLWKNNAPFYLEHQTNADAQEIG